MLVNPLHAPAPTTPVEPSPYLPVTRRFVSPLYLRVELVPEHAYLTGAVRAEIERTALLQRSVNTADVLLDRDAVWEAKRSALTLVHAVPAQPRARGRLPGVRAPRRRRAGRLRDLVRAGRGARRRLAHLARGPARPGGAGGCRSP